MDAFSDPLLLSRLQFAVTAMFHILWPVLSVGLSLFILLFEALWLKTGRREYYHHTRFWSRLFILNFTVGVVSGIPLEFQFGTNWAPFSVISGDFLGNILGFEGAMAFMLEAGFLGIMIFGWKRVAPGVHLFATGMVALGASLSAFWIMTASAWMQTPAGVHMENGSYVVDSYHQAILNPAMPWSVGHMWVAAIEVTVFVIGGISAWYILRRRHTDFFLRSFKLALGVAVVITPIQIWLGHGSGAVVLEHQPAKAAAIEGHWHTNPPGRGAPWAIVAWPDREAQKNHWALEIPNGLSLLATNTLTGQVRGLAGFDKRDQPPALPLLFYSFRFMVAVGFGLLALMLWTLWRQYRGRLTADQLPRQVWLLRAWMAALPLTYLAVETGWIVREVGRQPWLIHGMLRTSDGVSSLPAPAVGWSLLTYILIYLLLFSAFLVFARRLLRKGPDLEAVPHHVNARGERDVNRDHLGLVEQEDQ